MFTHDLDFSATLALTHAAGPSVLQLRGQAVLPENALAPVVAALRRYETELMAGGTRCGRGESQSSSYSSSIADVSVASSQIVRRGALSRSV